MFDRENQLANRAVWVLVAGAACWILVPAVVTVTVDLFGAAAPLGLLGQVQLWTQLLGLGLVIFGVVTMIKLRNESRGGL